MKNIRFKRIYGLNRVKDSKKNSSGYKITNTDKSGYLSC